MPQSIENNLKNLDKVKIKIVDEKNVLSSILTQKLITETKLQLMSAGIKSASSDEKSAVLEIRIRYIESKFADHRILVQLSVIEPITTDRKSGIKTDAITYYDDAFFFAKDVSTAVTTKLKDEMLIHFMEKYMEGKS
jgi:hypothetical protein